MQFRIDHLGLPQFENPLATNSGRKFVDDHYRILMEPHFNDTDNKLDTESSFELAGPRANIFFEPSSVKAAIVTCGGLCPGINSVIRSIVNHLWDRYGCRQIYGITYGYQGLAKDNRDPLLPLDPETVSGIHRLGGSILGSSRGTPPTAEIVDTLVKSGINMLFVIGGDGTLRGAHAIYELVKQEQISMAIIGIPKTIDNDIPFVRRSFGFETAVQKACEAIESAYTEASGLRRGIGLVKLMGRHSGYIAANACLAVGQVDVCLVPEVPFALNGDNGLLKLIEQLFQRKNSVIIVVAEGAGQENFDQSQVKRDASGNVVLSDVGIFLKETINAHFRGQPQVTSLKYIDPSYIIRAATANTNDQMFCARLGQNAVHAAMAGKTGLLIGYWHGRMTHVPLQTVNGRRQSINPHGDLWYNVLETTGQPAMMV